MMSPSLFYMEKYVRRFSVSLLAIEVYSIESEKAGDDDQLLYDALVTTVSKVCGVSNPTEEDFNYFVSRLKNLSEELSEEPEIKKSKNIKSFGTSYLKYLNALSIESVIFKMTNYNPDMASKLYCDMDRNDVNVLVKQFVTGETENNLVAMEAAMYGFGGSYSKDTKEADKTYELNSPEGLSALRSLGF